MTKPNDAIDMSPAAIAGRLEQVRALYKLMRHLEGARPAESPAATTATTITAAPRR